MSFAGGPQKKRASPDVLVTVVRSCSHGTTAFMYVLLHILMASVSSL